jgi:hypothetical protein
MKPVYWPVPRLWPGETVVLIGGGPSLTPAQVNACKHRARVIAINDALRLAPWCDVHYFCDDRWWRWHHRSDWYKAYTGLRITLENLHLAKEDPTLKSVQNVGRPDAPKQPTEALCSEPTGVMPGRNSGYQCINLAVHLGAKRILLLGFDMKGVLAGRSVRTHWFGKHPDPTADSVYAEFLQQFPKLVKPLAALGVDVINCSPDSALGCFKKTTIEEALDAPRVLHDPGAAALSA